MKASAGKRVLMVIENSPYPLDIRVRYEAAALTGAGYQVAVVCQRAPGEPWSETIDDVFVYRYPAPLQAQRAAGYLLEYGYSFVVIYLLSLFVWARRGFDILHAANPPDFIVLIALFYKVFGKHFVFDHHDLTPEMYLARVGHDENRPIYKILVWLEKLSFRFANHVIATNQSYKNIAMRRGQVPAERVTVVRNGPSLNRLKLVEPDPDLKNKEMAIIGYIGVIGPQDGLDYLLRALKKLMTVLGRQDFYCIIIGKGSALEDLKALSSELELDAHVRFTGFIPFADVLRYLSSVDICVDPDPANGFNEFCTMIKMMEYMTLSKPIVAFDLPEHRVTAGEAAVYAHPNDELDFARHIAALMDDPQRRERMGRVGRQRIENELAWSHQAEHLLEAYRAMDNHRGRTG